jgi:hypothetical protein
MRYMTPSPDILPATVEQLKCELYPKNAEQMWASYNSTRDGGMTFYDDDLVSEAIETSWHIAHDIIGDVTLDNSLCLPSFVVPKGMTDMAALVEACKDGLKARGLSGKKEYTDRLKMELGVVREMKFARYFLLMKRIVSIAHQHMLVGPGRGSGGGSLINYVLDITDIDPIKYGLYFERFLNKARCLDPKTIVMTDKGTGWMASLREGDSVMGPDGFVKILSKAVTRHERVMKVTLGDQTITCSPNHKWCVLRDGRDIMIAEAKDLRSTDQIRVK